MNNLKASFTQFVWIWNELQGLQLPKHHRRICHFLSSNYLQKKAHALLMAFRNSGKSTLVGLFCAWLLYENSNVRILIMSADYELAKKMVRNVKRIIEKHPLTVHLKPKQKDQWASDRFTVIRSQELRDPSVLARGIDANITGCRADVIVCDDVEVPKNCDTQTKRNDLKEKLSELDFVLVPNGFMLYVGTPHTQKTIYDVSPNGFLKNFNQLKLPILDEQGNSNWPERFSLLKIEAIRKRAGPLKFTSQMLLQPVNLRQGHLNTDNLIFYQDALDYRQINQSSAVYIGQRQMISASAWWDPSFGKSDADRSVLACVFFDNQGNAFVHDLVYLTVENAEKSAQIQCQKVAQMIKLYHLPQIRIETNGIGKFLPELLKQTLQQMHIVCAVLPVHSSIPKSLRISESLDARLASSSLWLHERVKQTPFMEEITSWNPQAQNMHDDGLDALSGCLSSEPVHIAKHFIPIQPEPDWRYGQMINNFNLDDVKL
ncbi:MAG: hypothetical protein E7013_00845 [Alphaproteobacteria bacterium]|nr:hypothetical protein [Alphaproteobacteria bacterium]